jgi:hypothetical protein
LVPEPVGLPTPRLGGDRGIAAWIREHARTLDEHADSDILDVRVERRGATYMRLHDSLLALKRRGVPNMSDAAASKVLHQLQPELFVMWDRNIKPHAPVYGDFLTHVHRLAACLRDEAPPQAREDLGAYLSDGRLPNTQAAGEVPRRVQLVRGLR